MDVMWGLSNLLWGKEDSPNCPHCNERESLGHIQSRCKILEKPRITAHHMIWREILLQLFSLSGDEGDEHKWVIPSAVSADSHKELTVRQIIQHFGMILSCQTMVWSVLSDQPARVGAVSSLWGSQADYREQHFGMILSC